MPKGTCPFVPKGTCCQCLQVVEVTTRWKKQKWGAVLRWRNNTGRPLSPSQIHQKSISTLSKFYKTTLNAGRGHQAPRKADHCLQKQVGKNKKETKEVGRELRPGRESRPRKGVLRREKLPNTRKHSHSRVCGEPWKHRGQHNREDK